MARAANKQRKRPAPRKDKGRMQLYDVRVVDTATGEVIDTRTLDCSCWLFAHWWSGDLVAPSGEHYPEPNIIEVVPR